MSGVWRRLDDTLLRLPQAARAAFIFSLLGAIAAIDLFTGEGTHYGEMSVMAPALASALCSVLWTAVIAATAVGVFLLLIAVAGSPQGVDVPVLLVMILVACAVSIVVAGVRSGRERELVKARLTTEVLQRTMLRELPLCTGGVEVHGFYAAAEADSLVGGDVYEAVRTPFGTRLLIGDVCGKGLRAIHAASDVLTSFREAVHHQPTLERLAGRLEQAVARYNAQAAEEGRQPRFVTALLVEIGNDGQARIANCGHVAPYLIREGTVVDACYGDHDLPLGLGDLSDEPRRAVPLDFRPGDALLMCTDGVTEARGRDGAFYPLGDRLAQWTGEAAEKIAVLLRDDMLAYAGGGGQRDDATVLVVRHQEGG